MNPKLKPDAISHGCPEFPEPHLYHYKFPTTTIPGDADRTGFSIDFQPVNLDITPCPYQDWDWMAER